jgi:hypothetical protein
VVVIDHASIDGTREIAASCLGAGVLEIVDVPWDGSFDLAALLGAKERIFERYRHDWQLHVDADEWVHANTNRSLAEFLETVEPRFLAVDFDSFPFLPPAGRDLLGLDHRRYSTDYYFFAPPALRWRRAWRRGSGGSLAKGAGHDLPDVPDEQVHPERQMVRNYLGLSWSHAIGKRANRNYAPAALARGWHGNRLDMRTPQPGAFSPFLRVADPWDCRALDRSAPSPFQFWQAGFFAEPPEPALGGPQR